MAQQLEVYTDPDHLSQAILANTEGREHELLLCNLGEGILRFTDIVFPDVNNTDLFAQKYVRESKGRGPHFDVYDTLLDERYPYIGLYNFLGQAKVSTAKLPNELANAYDHAFPELSEEATEARRHFGAIALASPDVAVSEGMLDSGSGFILPQTKTGPYIVHEIIPERPKKPGEFMKFVVGADSAEARTVLQSNGYTPFEQLVTQVLSESKVDAKKIGGESLRGFDEQTDSDKDDEWITPIGVGLRSGRHRIPGLLD